MIIESIVRNIAGMVAPGQAHAASPNAGGLNAGSGAVAGAGGGTAAASGAAAAPAVGAASDRPVMTDNELSNKYIIELISKLRKGEYSDVIAWCNKVLSAQPYTVKVTEQVNGRNVERDVVKSDFSKKDNIYNVIATILLGQVFYYEANYVTGAIYLHDGLTRDKDYTSAVLEGSGIEKISSLKATVDDKDVGLVVGATRDRNKIDTFWRHDAGFVYHDIRSTERVDAKTALQTVETQAYLNAIGKPSPEWLADQSGETKDTVVYSRGWFANVVIPKISGLRTQVGTSEIDYGESKDVHWVFIPRHLTRNGTSDTSVPVTDANGNIIWDIIMPRIWDPTTHTMIDNPRWVTLPQYLKDLCGNDYTSLVVGPKMRTANLGFTYNIPFFTNKPKAEQAAGSAAAAPAPDTDEPDSDPDKSIAGKIPGSIDIGLGWQHNRLPLALNNFNRIGENGNDSYSYATRDLDTGKPVIFDFTSNKFSYSLGLNTANLFSFVLFPTPEADDGMEDAEIAILEGKRKNDWARTWYNRASIMFSGANLLTSDTNIYAAADRRSIDLMTEAMNYFNNRAAEIKNDPSNHVDGDLAKPLYDEVREGEYNSARDQAARLDEEIRKAKANLEKNKNRTHGAYSVAFGLTSSRNLWEGQLSVAPISFNWVISDDITNTGGAGLTSAIDPITLQPLGPEKYISWTPSLSWDPAVILGIPKGYKSLWLGDLLKYVTGGDSNGMYIMPLSLGFNKPIKKNAGYGVSFMCGGNISNIVKIKGNVTYTEDGKGYRSTDAFVLAEIGFPTGKNKPKDNAVASTPAPASSGTATAAAAAPAAAPAAAAPATVAPAPVTAMSATAIAAAPVRYVDDDERYIKPIFTFANGRSDEGGLSAQGRTALATMKELVGILFKKGLCSNDVQIVGSVSAGRTPTVITANNRKCRERADFGKAKLLEALRAQGITRNPRVFTANIDAQAAIEAEDTWLSTHDRAGLADYQNACRYYQLIIKLDPANWRTLKTDTALRTQLDAKKPGLSAQLDRLAQ